MMALFSWIVRVETYSLDETSSNTQERIFFTSDSRPCNVASFTHITIIFGVSAIGDLCSTSCIPFLSSSLYQIFILVIFSYNFHQLFIGFCFMFRFLCDFTHFFFERDKDNYKCNL